MDGVAGRHGRRYASGTWKECQTREGESPVREADNSEPVPEYRGTREILWEAGGPTPQA